MSDEKEVVTSAFQWWSDPLLWSVIAMFILGTIGRILVSDEPFDPRKFFGELILAAIGAIILYSFNLMQGMTPIQIVFFGALGSLGGVRLIEWIIKIAKKVKSSGVL